MNIATFKYMIEIERCGSISLAAKNMFLAQPNLSKAIKELEEEFNITIFSRTSKGVVATREGKELLKYVNSIQEQIDTLESIYLTHKEKKISLKIATPRASYITHAFVKFMSELQTEKKLQIHYREISSMDTIKEVLDSRYDLGIIRYEKIHESYYLSLLTVKGIQYHKLLEGKYILLCSEKSPLLQKAEITQEDLDECIEIVHGDKVLPTGEYVGINEGKCSLGNEKNTIFVYERGSQLDLLDAVPNTYMWITPVPKQILDRYHLVQVRNPLGKEICDSIIYLEGHQLGEHEKNFLRVLEKVKNEVVMFD